MPMLNGLRRHPIVQTNGIKLNDDSPERIAGLHACQVPFAPLVNCDESRLNWVCLAVCCWKAIHCDVNAEKLVQLTVTEH